MKKFNEIKQPVFPEGRPPEPTDSLSYGRLTRLCVLNTPGVILVDRAAVETWLKDNP